MSMKDGTNLKVLFHSTIAIEPNAILPTVSMMKYRNSKKSRNLLRVLFMKL